MDFNFSGNQEVKQKSHNGDLKWWKPRGLNEFKSTGDAYNTSQVAAYNTPAQ